MWSRSRRLGLETYPRSRLGLVSNNLANVSVSVSRLNVSVLISVSAIRVSCTSQQMHAVKNKFSPGIYHLMWPASGQNLPDRSMVERTSSIKKHILVSLILLSLLLRALMLVEASHSGHHIFIQPVPSVNYRQGKCSLSYPFHI